MYFTLYIIIEYSKNPEVTTSLYSKLKEKYFANVNKRDFMMALFNGSIIEFAKKATITDDEIIAKFISLPRLILSEIERSSALHFEFREDTFIIFL